MTTCQFCKYMHLSKFISDLLSFVITINITVQCHASTVYESCVCLSVCHKSVFYWKAKRRIMQTMLHDNPGTLFFWDPINKKSYAELMPNLGQTLDIRKTWDISPINK